MPRGNRTEGSVLSAGRPGRNRCFCFWRPDCGRDTRRNLEDRARRERPGIRERPKHPHLLQFPWPTSIARHATLGPAPPVFGDSTYARAPGGAVGGVGPFDGYLRCPCRLAKTPRGSSSHGRRHATPESSRSGCPRIVSFGRTSAVGDSPIIPPAPKIETDMLDTESRRDSWRLFPLRGSSDDQVHEVFPGGP
jgi:hypothetical protein